MVEQTVVAPSQLRGWDKECKSLVDAAQALGWTGRISSKGHWIGRSPDGTETMAVQPKQSSNRGLENTKARFTRWCRNHGRSA